MKTIKNVMAVFLLLVSGNIFAATVSWSELSSSYNLNNVFTLDIIGTGFISNVVGTDFTSNVDGGGVNIGFDASILRVLSISIDESVWDFGSTGISTGAINNATGVVDGVMVNTLSKITGDFIVATVQFQVIGEGSSVLSLTEFADNPWAVGGSTINPDFSNGSFDTPEVPVPATVWLFGSGFLGLIGVARRSKS